MPLDRQHGTPYIGLMQDTETTPGHSPAVPHVVPVEMLTFPGALAAIIAGEHVTVTRLEWDDRETYIYMGETKLRIHTGGADHDLLVSVGDMLGTDWVIR